MWGNFSWTGRIKCDLHGISSNLEGHGHDERYRVSVYHAVLHLSFYFGETPVLAAQPRLLRLFYSQLQAGDDQRRCLDNVRFYFKYPALYLTLNMIKDNNTFGK